jgi:phage terminase large subunit GpA-like protein
VPCPCCGAYQVLSFERLKWDSESWPHRAWFECAGHGCVIEHVDKPAMMAAGVWIATAEREDSAGPGDWFAAEDLPRWQGRSVPTRTRGFHVWKAYSLFSSWDGIVAEHLASKGTPEKERVFIQQVLGEAYEDKGDAPDAELLHKARLDGWRRGLPPVGPLVYTGATDVQGNRLEWAVWGWSEGMTRWLVDWGVIEGDPHDAATWAEHDRMVASRSYSAGGGAAQTVEAWAVDSGFASQHVYNYSRGRRGIFAVDGRHGRTEPFIGAAKKVDIKLNGRALKGGAVIWPVGTFPLKSDHYSAIRKTIAGPDPDGVWAPGSMILPGDVPRDYVDQLTAEHLLKTESRSGVATMKWAKLAGRPNEALDIACYARALAHHLGLDRLTPEQWAMLRAERGAPAPSATEPQGDLFAVAIAAPLAAAPQTKPAQRPAPSQPAAEDWMGGRAEGEWI